MPSPFPGMDPYLEAPELWPNVHHGLISEIQATLHQRLRPRYRSLVEERVYISDEMDPGRKVIVPDVAIQVRQAAEQPVFGDVNRHPQYRGDEGLHPLTELVAHRAWPRAHQQPAAPEGRERQQLDRGGGVVPARIVIGGETLHAENTSATALSTRTDEPTSSRGLRRSR